MGLIGRNLDRTIGVPVRHNLEATTTARFEEFGGRHLISQGEFLSIT
jgi:hypothetical protein